MSHRGCCYVLTVLATSLLGSIPSAAATLTIDRGKTYQTIEGFGFFGAADVWWSSASAVQDDAWAAKVIDDLGITMWRNEYYAEGTQQDATWDKQKPVVQSLVKNASQHGVKLKILLTVWSPPATLKCLSDDGEACSGNPPTRPSDTKGGHILDPAKRADLAAWLIAGAQMYKDVGADLYGVSFQNEPLFEEPYNSCVYTQAAYAQTLAAIGPTFKAAFPDVLLFGSENMLGIECGKSPGTAFDPYWYTANIMSNAGALAAIDAFAVHGYVDGVSATATSNLASMWTSFRDGTAKTGKRIWMTETSGYTHTWPGTKSAPGPLDLGQAIYASLAYGNLSAWTYWQGSEKDGYTEYSLMAGANKPGKNYYVSKQFFRFIRPGAQRVDLQSSDPEVMAVAFQHPTMRAFTVVVINSAGTDKPITLAGTNLPADFHAFRTSANDNVIDLGTIAAEGITVPASSITTFVNGSYREDDPGGSPVDGGVPGVGGGPGGAGSGGATGRGGAGGGAPGGTGGRTGTDGGPGSGGAAGRGGRSGSDGGLAGSGGTPAAGGIPGAGGVLGSGGVAAKGGAGAGGDGGPLGVGGVASTGGSSAGAGGANGHTGSSSNGCGCALGASGRQAPPLLAALALIAAARVGRARCRQRDREARARSDRKLP